jgi:hypothetical protein
MKKQVLIIAIFSLFTTLASAADLYVRDLGAGGAYATISAAISASSDGDRIIIRPKAGGIPYLENLTVNKSLSFVCETNFVKYLIQGSISITPAVGRVVSFSNLNLTYSLTVNSSTTGGRATLNVLNSIIGQDLNAGQSQTSLYASGNVITGAIVLTHGRCTANKCNNIIVTSSSSIEAVPATDDIEIIANALTYNGGDAINIYLKSYNFKLLNNYLAGGYVYITSIKTSANNEIRNNVINSNFNYPLYINLSSGNTGFISVMNNVMNSTNSIKIYNLSGVSLATVYAFYNMSSTAFSYQSVTSQSSNIGNASITLNDTTYSVSGANVNAGNSEDDYADIDLTRNDIGNWGGSNSWANYWPTSAGNKPQVNYLNTPRRIFLGTSTMNVNAAGNSK